MDALEAIKKRRSVRKFDKKPVSKKDIETLVNAGRMAPSARAVNPWEFVAVTDRNMLSDLGKMCPNGAFLSEAGAAVAVICKDTQYYLEDGSAATENILIAATALEIGSCWVAGDKKPYVQQVLDLLGVPAGFKLISIIALGYPAENSGRIQKKNIGEVLHWEKFQRRERVDGKR